MSGAPRVRGSRQAALLTCVIVASIGLAACERTGRAPDSGVHGQVLVGPVCPVVQAGDTCPDQPYPARLEVVDGAGAVVARGTADDNGRFQFALPAGSYRLAAYSVSDAPMPWASPVDFVVQPNAWTELSVSMDSGIR
jgi:hypothetical protein